MQSIIIGAGEIGTALHKIIGGEIVDRIEGNFSNPIHYDIIHIAFPYTEEFESEVKRYQQLFKAKHTVIHSTCPVGTCSKLGAISSPVNGIHPHLEQSLRTFIKFLGGSNDEVNDYFRRAGFKIYTFDKPETTELMKLMCTTFYGVCLEYVKDLKEQCDKYGVPFEAWTLWTNNYNKGYTKLGHPQYYRPNLTPPQGKIGGHCVLPNAKLIKTKFTDILNGNTETEKSI
jgi:hypothetical protein